MTDYLIGRVKSNALLIAKQIEKECGHILGEMSMDLGIDTEGQIWFLKPMPSR